MSLMMAVISLALRRLQRIFWRAASSLSGSFAVVTLTRLPLGHCQTNVDGAAKGSGLRRSGCKLTPLGQGGRAVLSEDIAAVEVTVVVEMVVD